ncbi:MAG TPA: hypothetical protein VK550_07395, partial [Polyangiaceae bacterium]|nr:hypothetical protein [Polyangiaceae bacterium]
SADGAVRAVSLTNPVPLPPREVCRARIEMNDAEVDAGPDGGNNLPIIDIAVDEQWVYFSEPSLRQISKCIKR